MKNTVRKKIKTISLSLQQPDYIKMINLRDFKINLKELEYLCQFAKNNTFLTDLNFSHNDLDNEGAKLISELLKSNQKLKEINLGWNKIEKEGIKLISNSLLTHNGLQQIYLSGNKIDKEGALQVPKKKKY